MYDLSVEVKNQKSLYDALQKYISGEVISGFECPACNQTVDITRRNTLAKLPNMLLIHMQRIVC